ncbi:beta-defensin 128 [Otolemur garnettii]|uniref:beta-defensin 128 n=1 Tax=Otolemur garnettii TaxID=30611 RepID=UPI0002742A0C|nr:beta-defensin 128 [Otolemur garnettii]
MKLFLVLVILLFEVLTDGARPRKCSNEIGGFCRKKCKVGEVYESGCLRRKLCCVDEYERRKYLAAHNPPRQPGKKVDRDEKLDYSILPTVTLVTIDF